MKKIFGLMMSATALFFLITGCAAVNKTLDKASDVGREAGKPVGKVMNIPGSVAEGAAEGMQKNEDNPFNR